MPTPATLEGIAAALDALLALARGLGPPGAPPLSGLTLGDARSFAKANKYSFNISPDGNTISFYRPFGPGLGQQLVATIPLL